MGIRLTSKSIGICTVNTNTSDPSMESILKFIILMVTWVMEVRITEVTAVIRAIPDMATKSHLTEDMKHRLTEATNHLTDLIPPVQQQAKKKASQKETET